MTITINQFMWSFQHTFRRIVEIEIQHVLSQIGLQANSETKVLLIGFATRDDKPYQVCIEPEDGHLQLDDLCSVGKRTDEIAVADPASDVFHSHPQVAENRSRRLTLGSRAYAVAEAIEASGKFEGSTFFVSASAPIGDYEVHTCVGLPSNILESVPSFNNPARHHYLGRHVEESFVQAILHTCLERADNALYLPNPGMGPGILGNRIDIVRSSADRFIKGLIYALTSNFDELQTFGLNDAFRWANEFSSLTYERSGAQGHLAITRPDNLTNKLKVKFQSPVGLNENRSVRKILELTDDSTSLLADSDSVYGLGECASAPDVAKITVEGHARWSISVDDIILMRVDYEHAALPKQILDKALFEDVAERTVGAVEVERIWGIVQSALEDDHGTTIVVSKEPVAEIDRLAQQALPIKPEYLEHKDVARLGRVDGAILLGPDGRCYAFGVILDGLAASSGDRARGARFNSSMRYQQTFKEIGTMVIVISDDGTVDLIPNLMPRVWLQQVEDAVQAFCEYSENEEDDGEEWVRRNEQVASFRFYLNQDQCDRVNESYEKVMGRRLESGRVSSSRKRIKPNPELDDSYFFDR